MEIADVLVVLYGHDLAELLAIDDFLDFRKEVRISEDMAYNHFPACFIGFSLYSQAFFRTWRNGLFQQNIIPKIKRSHRLPVMIAVHGRNNDGIANFAEPIKFIYGFKLFLQRNLKLVSAAFLLLSSGSTTATMSSLGYACLA